MTLKKWIVRHTQFRKDYGKDIREEERSMPKKEMGLDILLETTKVTARTIINIINPIVKRDFLSL